MSIISDAKRELALVNFGEEDSARMIEILELFFGQWDSGGAVYFAAPVLQKLIAGKPLSPLTGEPSEWNEVGDGVFQNNRCSTVFKDPRFHGGKQAYDLENPDGSRAAISFPYTPIRNEVSSPVVMIDTGDEPTA